MNISKRAKVIQPSITLGITAKANELKARGIDVVSFGAGEPDFDTPEFIKNVAIEDLNKGVTKYTAERGTPDLLKAVCETLERDYGLTYDTSQVMVSVGGKHSLFNTFFCMVNDGDGVIIPSPYWVSYPEQVRACGGVAVIAACPPESGFKMTPELLRSKITPRTVALVLNSPSNPTGSVYTKDELLAIGRVLEENPHVNLITDDLYQKLVYAPAEFHSLPAMMPSLLPRTIIINGWSKAFSMTGWRLGWAAGPKDFMKACANLQGQSTSNVTTFTQRAAAVALRDNQSFMKPWLEKFNARRKMIVDGLNAIDGIRCPEPLGAFYAFPDVSGCFGKKVNGREIKDSMTFAEIMLEEAKVAVVPGAAFGENRCARLSYATKDETIAKGLQRLAEALRK
ncbi:pyridoxal phosphate-dependent aminotransferase [Candidatus Sumerlaeota bacterium]|nr:pyridoxal phosphate-dependent aminotransferase [Candidatus Sumerlaeota bacterium]